MSSKGHLSNLHVYSTMRIAGFGRLDSAWTAVVRTANSLRGK